MTSFCDRNSPRRLIVCADDFGRDVAINEAVEAAHQDGILSSASLMVGAPAGFRGCGSGCTWC
jgi:predicted glycoside hydrolase/deacetylase ChbG (UPF0249 family)